jgi:hypothetical protein
MIIRHVNATPSDAFIDHLSGMIYSDCQNKNISIKEGFLNLTKGTSSISFTFQQWPYYDYSFIRRIIQLLGENEPYDIYASCAGGGENGITRGLNGCGILNCSNYTLDIIQYTYFWRGTRVDVPKEEFTYGANSPIISAGNNNLVTTGNNSPVTQTIENNTVTTGNNSPVTQTIENNTVTTGNNSPVTQILTSINFSITISIALSVSFIFNIYFLIKQRKRKRTSKKKVSKIRT